MTTVVFLAAVLGISIVLGLPVVAHPTLRHVSVAARLSLAWTMGSLILTMVLTFLSAIGARWTGWWMLLACVTAIALALRMLRMAGPAATTSVSWQWPGLSVGGFGVALVALSGLSSLVLGVGTSADLSYFWGVKAAHFALEGGIDFELLRQPFMIHLHPNYPPLWPVLLGWGALAAQSMPWLTISSLTWICLTAAAAIIFSTIATSIGSRAAGIVTLLWYGILTTMMLRSFSGGNADGPLLLFLSVALVVIVTERANESPRLRWLAALALAGAVFTKSEGMIATALIVVGTTVRDVMWRRPAVLRRAGALILPALVTAGFWLVVRIAHDLPLSDPIRESAFHVSFDHIDVIIRVCIRILISGAVLVGWLIPLVTLLIVGRDRLVATVPGVVTALGILTFAAGYYLHAMGDPLQLIVWTFPRLIVPAMSAWILSLGVAVFAGADTPEADAPSEGGPI